MKYKDGIFFALGVPVIENKDGTVEGRQCRMIDYIRRVVISEKEETRCINDEIKRVGGLAANRDHGINV